jgi:hypothetical protein
MHISGDQINWSTSSQGFPRAHGSALTSQHASTRDNSTGPQSTNVPSTASALTSNATSSGGGTPTQSVMNSQSNIWSPQTGDVYGSTAPDQPKSSR